MRQTHQKSPSHHVRGKKRTNDTQDGSGALLSFSSMAWTIQAVRLSVRASIALTSSWGSLRWMSSRVSYCLRGPRRFGCSAIFVLLSALRGAEKGNPCVPSLRSVPLRSSTYPFHRGLCGSVSAMVSAVPLRWFYNNIWISICQYLLRAILSRGQKLMEEVALG